MRNPGRAGKMAEPRGSGTVSEMRRLEPLWLLGFAADLGAATPNSANSRSYDATTMCEAA